MHQNRRIPNRPLNLVDRQPTTEVDLIFHTQVVGFATEVRFERALADQIEPESRQVVEDRISVASTARSSPNSPTTSPTGSPGQRR